MPQELCVCETIAKEAKKIAVVLVQKRYSKYATVIKGLDASQINVKELLTKLKSKLACGGTYKNGEIELQGSHRPRVKQLLIQEGFPEEMIEVK